MTVHDLNARRISPEFRSWKKTLDAATGRAPAVLMSDRDDPAFAERIQPMSEGEMLRIHRELYVLIWGRR